jgi:two-component system, cell cycle sensor histidine kinase and response regulator CckA
MSEERFKHLRHRAEEQLSVGKTQIENLDRANLESLTHELMVHQIELEIQNEELRISRADAEEARDRYLDLFDFAPVGYFTLDGHNLVIEANLSGCQLLKIDRSRLLKQTFTRFILPEDGDKFYFQRRKVMESGTRLTVELQMQKEDGTPFYARIDGLKVGEEGLRLAISDITQLKELNIALSESEEKYRRIIDNSRDLIFEVNLAGDLIYVSPSVIDLLGYDQSQLIGSSIWTLIHPEDLPKIRRLTQRNVADKYQVPGGVDFRVRHMSGDWRWHNGKGKTARDINGAPLTFVGISRDITENKKMEQLLKDNEERFRSVFDHVNDGIMIVDLKTRRLNRCNNAMWKMLGYSPGEAATLEFSDVHPEKQLQIIEQNIQNGITRVSERELTRKDGSILFTEVTPSYITFSGQQYLVSVFRDITELKQLEEERQRSEKLESIGTLAGGIAHDFNNLLTGIIGNISLAKSSTESHGEIFEILEEAEKASLRARDLTQQLLTFSRGGEPVKTLFDVSKLIRDTTTFALRGSSVLAEFFLPDDLWRIEADEGQISQVIDNLVINAVQSMLQGGTINVSAGNQIIEEANSPHMAAGTYVHISIADQGIGIPEVHKSKIFEPYFTTKQKGSGLGLATSYSIIKKHQGYISFSSEPGKGTTFDIYLPASRMHVLSGNEASLSGPIAGTGTILVVDDEPMIRRLLNTVISRAGYKVEESASGEEAVAKYLKAKEGGLALLR